MGIIIILNLGIQTYTFVFKFKYLENLYYIYLTGIYYKKEFKLLKLQFYFKLFIVI